MAGGQSQCVLFLWEPNADCYCYCYRDSHCYRHCDSDRDRYGDCPSYRDGNSSYFHAHPNAAQYLSVGPRVTFELNAVWFDVTDA